MSALAPPAPLLCVLLCVSLALQRSDLRVAYVTHSSSIYYSCSQEPQACSLPSLDDCRCKDIQQSTLHHPHSHSSPIFHMKRLTVWFTSPLNTARLLNNSEVRHLTLIHCGPGGGPWGTPPSSDPPPPPPPPPVPEGYFAVQHLERLTVVKLRLQDSNRAKESNSDTEGGNSAYMDTNRYNKDRDTYQDLRDTLGLSQHHVQEIFLNQELGAAYHEQARLGIIHSSVLEWGAELKAYTVQTHIDSDGVLPFPELHLQKLPVASVIYVSFVY